MSYVRKERAEGIGRTGEAAEAEKAQEYGSQSAADKTRNAVWAASQSEIVEAVARIENMPTVVYECKDQKGNGCGATALIPGSRAAFAISNGAKIRVNCRSCARVVEISQTMIHVHQPAGIFHK